MATPRTDTEPLTKPRWPLYLHGHEQRESNIRRARSQLRRLFPHLSESQADDQVRDHYDGILERVAAPRNPDGAWPYGAFPHEDGSLEDLDGWIVNAVVLELRNYQRNRANRHESLDGAQESGGEGAIDGWPAASAALDPAMLAEERDTLDAVLAGASEDVRRYVLLARVAGQKRSEIQRQMTWSDRKFKKIKAASDRFVDSARDAYRALPVFVGRWVFHSSNTRVRAGGGATLGAGAGVGAVKVGTAIVASVAVVGGAALELHSKPAHHAAPHARVAVLPVPVPALAAATTSATRAAGLTPRTAKAPSRQTASTTSSASRRSAQLPPGLSYLGAPTSQSSGPPSAVASSTSSSAPAPVVSGGPPRKGGLSYLGGP